MKRIIEEHQNHQLFNFTLSDKEIKKLTDWMQSQSHSKEQPGVNGGVYTYFFTPTTIGLVIKVKNNITNEEIDISSYGDW